MRVLIEHGSYSLTNLGDLAMLRVCVERVREFVAGADIFVPTSLPDRLGEFIPGVTAVEIPLGARISGLAGAVSRLQSRPLAGPLIASLVWMQSSLGPGPASVLQILPEPPDLVIHAGSGLFADPFAASALRRATVLTAAQRAGIPTAMFSQGVGPLRNRFLRREVSRFLPGMKLIGARERLFTPSTLSRLGARPDQIPITGDDSLELAFRSRPEQPGHAIGLNLRWSSYGLLNPDQAELGTKLSSLIGPAAGSVGAPILPVVIHSDDLDAVQDLAPAGLRLHPSSTRLFSIENTLAAIAECRLVFTTSYHGAVLALGQGIPAACLFRSEYYRRKFRGLADFFPQGCVLVDLEDEKDQHVLLDQLSHVADQPGTIRDNLLTATEDLILSSRKAYQDLFRMIEYESQQT